MLRTIPAAVLGALLLVGCGSGGSDATDEEGSSESSPSARPSTTYFVRADSDRINKAAAKAQKAANAALNQKRMDACNDASGSGYAAWRRCWHALLDPFETSMLSLAATMTALGSQDLPQACRDELEQAASTFAARAKVVSRLLAGIDSEQRKDQDRAMRTYTGSLEKMAKKWAKPFQDLTQACYSPEELASINASPSASP